MESNPYAPPQAEVLPPPMSTSEAVRLREEHIQTEFTLKTAGVLYHLAAVGLIYALFKEPRGQFLSLVLGGGAMALLGLGVALWRLQSWVLVPVIIVSLGGFFLTPIGALLNGAVLWSIASKKGRFVLRPEYKTIIAAAPRVRCEESRYGLIVLMVLLAILAVIVLCVLALPFVLKLFSDQS
jgi:hypothetical protein